LEGNCRHGVVRIVVSSRPHSVASAAAVGSGALASSFWPQLAAPPRGSRRRGNQAGNTGLTTMNMTVSTVSCSWVTPSTDVRHTDFEVVNPSTLQQHRMQLNAKLTRRWRRRGGNQRPHWGHRYACGDDSRLWWRVTYEVIPSAAADSLAQADAPYVAGQGSAFPARRRSDCRWHGKVVRPIRGCAPTLPGPGLQRGVARQHWDALRRDLRPIYNS